MKLKRGAFLCIKDKPGSLFYGVGLIDFKCIGWGCRLKRLVYMIVTIFHIVESVSLWRPVVFLRFWSFHVNSCVHIFYCSH